MYIEIIKATISGGESVGCGDRLTVPEAEGRLLLALGRAKPCTAKKPEPSKKRKG